MSGKQSFVLTIGGGGGLSDEGRDALLVNLLEELRFMPSVEVEREQGRPPTAGEKSFGPLGDGLLVQIAGSALTVALPPLVDAVRAWVGRQALTSQAITISCSGLSMEIAAGTPTADVAKLIAEATKGASG